MKFHNRDLINPTSQDMDTEMGSFAIHYAEAVVWFEEHVAQ